MLCRVQGWSDSTEQAAQVEVTSTLAPHSPAISSAVLTITRLALQLEPDFANGAISATNAIARAALPPPITATASSRRAGAPRPHRPAHSTPSPRLQPACC